MYKIAFINPPSASVGKTSRAKKSRVLTATPPYGIASVAGVAKAAGHTIRVWEIVTDPIDDSTLLKQLQEFAPDIICVSIIGPAHFWLQAIAPRFKDRLPNAKLIVGNAVASEYPDWYMREVPACDVIIRGEGETAFAAYLSEPSLPAPGIYTRDSTDTGFAKPCEDLDALPPPAWSEFPLHKYRVSPQFLMGDHAGLPLLQSRGCPWTCSFCAQNYMWDKVRTRSIESIAEEIKQLNQDFGVRHFAFLDSIFPLKRDYGEQLYRELESRNLIGKIRLGTETRVELIWPDTYRWLAKAGLHMTMLGIESANPELLNSANKLKSAQYPVEQAVNVLVNNNIRAYGLFVIGFPGETAQQRKSTQQLMLDLPLDMASVSIYSSYAGSPDARSSSRDPSELLDTNIESMHADPTIVAAQASMMRAFFLRPSLIAKHLYRREIPLSAMANGAKLLMSG